MLKFKESNRGFVVGNFKDTYNLNCSIQESSSASEACIWLGVDDAKPMIMASQAAEFGINTTEITGWVPYPIPDEVLLHTRMHLNQEQARELIKALQIFVETGLLRG